MLVLILLTSVVLQMLVLASVICVGQTVGFSIAGICGGQNVGFSMVRTRSYQNVGFTLTGMRSGNKKVSHMLECVVIKKLFVPCLTFVVVKMLVSHLLACVPVQNLVSEWLK
jgi:UPF0716 family protein affecting phage T7 exclusion